MTPFVLVHGFLGGSGQWHRQAPLGEVRELVRIDLPGFGKNARLDPINSIEKFAKWILSELSDQGIERFDLLGHSMGGMIVQEMCRLAPSRIDRLILYGTGAQGALPGRFETIAKSKERARTDGVPATGRRIAATWFLDGTAAKDYPATSALAEMPSLEAVLAGLDAMEHWNGQEQLAKIKSKTLVLWGDLDRSYGWPQIKKLWRSIPTCNLAVVPNCAHAVHSEQPELFNSLVNSFLSLKA
ncbi:MAG: alpha/beta hydrolase [Pseudomonadota bacterium]